MNQAPLYVFSTVCALACLIAVWQAGLRPYCLDKLRERLFALRFSLFEVGLSGAVGYDSDVYRTFESLLNALLRYAHEFPSSSYVIAKQANKAVRPSETDYAALLIQKIKSTEPDVQIELTRIYNDMQRALLMYVVSVSPLALLFGLFLVCKRAFFTPIEKTRIAIAEALEREAMTEYLRARAARPMRESVVA